MEQHQVPRNITTFQFHLIGDMTLRQFAYLAAGAVGGYLIYQMLPVPQIVKIPIVVTIAFIGFAFGFIPIQERPLDRWLGSFLRSIFSPTQYLWKKEGTVPEVLIRTHMVKVVKMSPQHAENDKIARQRLQSYLSTLPSTWHQALNIREKQYLDSTIRLFDSVSIPAGYSVNKEGTPSMSPQEAPVPELNLQTAFSQTPHEQPGFTPFKPSVDERGSEPSLKKIPAGDIPDTAKESDVANQPAGENYNVILGQLSQLSKDKENLAKQLENLRSELKKSREPQVVTPQPYPEDVKKSTIKTINPKTAVTQAGMPNLPQSPNIIMGIVKDAEQKLLPNIIITIKDAGSMPLRALKTNKLGQFASATPLPNGTYFLEVEDPLKRYVFDIARISLSGKSYPPIEVNAKGEKELMREKLNKEIFGKSDIL